MGKRSRKKSAPEVGSGQVYGIVCAVPRRWDWSPHDWLWGCVLFFSVVLVYLPVCWAGFIWDDDLVVTGNPCIVGPLGLKEIWTTRAADICPLTLTLFWVEHAWWGLRPPPYHLLNVLLFAMSAVLLWRLLRNLRIPAAWLGAALWAFHPVQVESVAWISEMKNTLSGFFFLLTILLFVRALREREAEGPGAGSYAYALSLLGAALAMASKSTTVILPLVLGLCCWWVEGRWRWNNLVRLAPFFLLSILAGIPSIWTQELQGFNDLPRIPGLPERLAAGGDAVWFYLGKLLWPHPLLTVYRRWNIDAGQPLSYLSLLAVLVTLAISWLKRRSWSKPYFFAYAYFLVALLPALGLINMVYFRDSFVADHFQYLASMGPLALAGAGLSRFSDRLIPGKTPLPAILGAGLLSILGVLSWRQAWVYQDQETLWSYTLARNPNCWAGYNNIGNALMRKGRVDDAIATFRKALEINPYDLEAYHSLGAAFFQKGDLEAAMIEDQKLLQIQPRYEGLHNNLGLILDQKGRLDEALIEYQKALAVNPLSAEARLNVGNVLAQKGQVSEAIEQYRMALAIKPDYAEAHNSLGIALFDQGKVDEAIEEYQKALEINSAYPEADNNLAIALFQKGEADKALALLQEAVRLKPAYRDAQVNLAKMKSLVAPGKSGR